MLAFQVQFKPGIPLYEQVVFAVKKAIVSGQMMTGDKFPSVRVLSQELRINPNTAHKILSALVDEGLLEVSPGIGTVVAAAQPATKKQCGELLGADIERLVVEAQKLGLDLEDVEEAIKEHWKRIKRGRL
ncbi:MAG: GntR family transcriptional regulator [Verrucomicrobiia bacterium]